MTLELPRVGERVERTRLDIKGEYVGSTMEQKLEMAKDIAAFANGVGGRIVVGAWEGAGGVLAKYAPLPPARVSELREAFGLAVRDLLRPPPVFDVRAAPAPGATEDGLVIVDVDPFPGQAVAVVVKGNGEPSFRFPVRVGTRTVFFSPEQLGLIMDASFRRKAQLVASIPVGSIVGIIGGGLLAPRMYRVIDLDVERNVFFVERTNDAGQRWKEPIGVAIDSVIHVYPRSRGGDAAWLISLAGLMPDDLAPTPDARKWRD